MEPSKTSVAEKPSVRTIPEQKAVPEPGPPRGVIAEWTVTIILLLFGTTTLVQAFVIPTGSMEDTLLVGDHLLVDKLAYAPGGAVTKHLLPYSDVKRGDIIVFFKPTLEANGEHLYLVKRVIGIPGDHIHLVNGTVYLNGVAQNEPQAQVATETYDYRDDFPAVPPPPFGDVTAEWALDLPNHIQNGDLVVPPGSYFAMGDNRPNSLDSRYWGFVPRQNIVGRPLFVYWSFVTPENQYERTGISDRAAFIGHIILHFFDQTRWRRTLHLVK